MNLDQMALLIRGFGLSLVGVWGWYLAAMFRTSGWGDDNLVVEVFASLKIFSIFALPLAFLPLLGVPWRRKFLALAILVCICMLAVEVPARAQEHLLVRRLEKNPRDVYMERRWWPFEHHDLGIVHGQRWGCD